MSIGKSTLTRTVLLAAGCAGLATAMVLLARQQLVAGFLVAFSALSAISLSETGIDYEARYSVRSFFQRLGAGRSYISALGRVCDAASYLCLAAALISWLALR